MFKSIKFLSFSSKSFFQKQQYFFSKLDVPYQDANNVSAETHQYQAREIYKQFSRKVAQNQGNDYILLKTTIDDLRGVKLGIMLSDPLITLFAKDLNQSFQRLQTIDHLLDIMREMLIFEIRLESFWQNAFEFVWSLKPELYKKDTYIIGFFYILMQGPYKESFLRKEPSLIQELQKVLLGLRGSPNTGNLPLEGLIEFLTLNSELGLENQVFTKLFQEKLLPRYKEMLKKSSTYFLSHVSFLLHKLYYEPYPNKEASGQLYKLITELNETVIYNDLATYDTDLQNYEFSEFKQQEIGFKDLLSYKTLLNLICIFKDQRFYNQELLIRVEDAIIRKSETDLIDLQNASNLLYHLSRFQSIGNNGLIRLLEMVIWLFQEENAHMGMYLTKINIMRLVDGIALMAYNKNIDDDLLSDVLNFVASKIEGGMVKLGGGFQKDDWEFLQRVYEMKRFAGKFNGFINFMKKQKSM